MLNKALIVVVAIAVVVATAILLLGNNTGQKQSAQQTQPTPTSTTTQTTSPTMQNQTTTVTVTASGFNPQVVSIKAGDKVVWVNKSGQMANVSSDPHPIHTAYPPLNLGSFSDGSSVSLVFDKPGKYGYHNHLDASQTGTVVVTQ